MAFPPNFGPYRATPCPKYGTCNMPMWGFTPLVAILKVGAWGGGRSKIPLFVDARPVRGQGGWVGGNAVPIIHVDEEINVFGQAQRKQEVTQEGRWCCVLLATQAKC